MTGISYLSHPGVRLVVTVSDSGASVGLPGHRGEGRVAADSEGTIIVVNERAGNLWRYDRDRVICKSGAILNPRKCRHAFGHPLPMFIDIDARN